jgi:hypothetical protein
MVNNRWFKLLVSFVLLGSVVFTSAATVADISSGVASPTLSNCQEAVRRGAGTVLPSGLSDRELCSRLLQLQGDQSSAAGLLAAIANRGGFTVNLAATTWGDAGASRPLSLAQAAAQWRDAGAIRLQAADYITPGDDWMDAGATRLQAAGYITPGDDWMDVGAGQR